MDLWSYNLMLPSTHKISLPPTKERQAGFIYTQNLFCLAISWQVPICNAQAKQWHLLP